MENPESQRIGSSKNENTQAEIKQPLNPPQGDGPSLQPNALS